MYQKGNIRVETLIILGVLFCFYVVGDIMTTAWLIDHYPGGIEGESNPLAALIFSGYGLAGLMVSKVFAFILISLCAIMIEFHYGNDRRSMKIRNLMVMGLMGWSIVIITNNVGLTYILSLYQGTPEGTFLLRLYLSLFSIVLAGLIGLPMFTHHGKRIVQAMLAVSIIFGPLAFSPQMYEFLLAENPLNFIIYGISMLGITALMLFSSERFYKQMVIRQRRYPF